jgi:type II secretory pathway pseudopilin PulG
MHMKRTDKGFTLIELLLAMTFISTLLLTIAMTIVQIANIYNHGMILKELNQTARAVTQELDRAVRASSSFSTNIADRKYVNSAWGGRMCLGQYSYVWNYGTALSRINPNRNFYSSTNSINAAGNIVQGSTGARSEISFVKVLDPAGSYCVPNVSGVYLAVDPTDATELLRSGDHSLVIHALSVTSIATAKDTLSAQELYKFSFTLGTSDINALTTDSTGQVAANSLCKAPNIAGSDLNYCSIEQFTIVLRAISGVN